METAKSRSYIDIDATDPFKVPKSSHYINRPIPEFTQAKDDNKEFEETENSNHHSSEHDDAPSSKGMENADDDVKNVDAGSHQRERDRDREREEGEKENAMEKPNDTAEEHDANIDEQPPAQEDSTNSSPMPKEMDLPDNGRIIQGIEQDSQAKQSMQNIDSGNEESDEGYKKTHIDPNSEEEGVTATTNNNNNNNGEH